MKTEQLIVLKSVVGSGKKGLVLSSRALVVLK